MAAALTVPPLIGNIGLERFGLLALAWGLIGYAGSLDLGLGRALTQMVASLRGERRYESIPDILATASRVALIVGAVAGLLVALFAIFGGNTWFKVTNTASDEMFMAIILLAVGLPAQSTSATYRGLNEAYLNFKGISLLRAGMGMVNFVGPYLISHLTDNLAWLVSSLVLSRLLALAIYRHLAMQCLNADNNVIEKGLYTPSIFRSLISFGGWVTLSSIISPVMVQADRFVIGVILSAAAVSIYVLPYEVVVQSLIIVSAVSSVMFPQLSKLMKESSYEEWRAYFNKWLRRVCWVMGVVCLVLAFTLPVILPFWLKETFNKESALIGQVLCVGVFFNSIGSMYYALLHARNKTAVTAKIHLLELPIYLIMLIVFINEYSLIGAAYAWSARMAIDALALAYFSKRASCC